MKSFKLIMAAMAFMAIGLTISSCGNKSKTESTAATEEASDTAKLGAEYTSAYVCPMHCKESGSDKAGNCPVCGMAYEENQNHVKNGHMHDGHDHGGHDHDGHDHNH